MSKVQVRKDTCYPGWEIFGEVDGRVFWETRITWREAMQLANELPRTITVTLPRDIDTAGRYTLRNHQTGVQLRHKKWPKKRGEFCITHSELEPLAMALLAHARKAQQ